MAENINLDIIETNCKFKHLSKKRNELRNVDDYIAPEDIWSWLVVIASGFFHIIISILHHVIFEFNYKLGIQDDVLHMVFISSIVSGLTGLFNGPLYRHFSHLQIALVSAIFIVSGQLIITYANNISFTLIAFNILYGIGFGLANSVTFVAVLMHFKKKRTAAISFLYLIQETCPNFFVPLSYTFIYDLHNLVFTLLSVSTFLFAMFFRSVPFRTEKVINTTIYSIPPNEDKRSLPFYKKAIKYLGFDLLIDIHFVKFLFGLIFIETFGHIGTKERFYYADARDLYSYGDMITRTLIGLSSLFITRLNNKYLVAFGVFGTVIGRLVYSYNTERKDEILYNLAICLGISGAFYVIFSTLILSNCVSLKKLPVALGLQLLYKALLTSGRNWLNNLVTENVYWYICNACCLVPIIAWILEDIIKKYLVKKPIISSI